MPRQPRLNLGGYVYHIINRANARIPIFQDENDYKIFENVLEDAKEKYDMRILAYCLMPNHFHFALYPKGGKDLSRFMYWVTMTFTQRWHAKHGTVGYGHLFQGRYKAFIVNTDNYFTALIRYIERNPVRAKLVKRAELWKWNSLYRRINGTDKQKKLLSDWPVEIPEDYISFVNEPLEKEILEEIRQSTKREQPLGNQKWREDMIKKYGLEHTIRSRGRPRKGS